MNYLEIELQERLKSEDYLLTFLQDRCLNGIWYWDLENPENEWMSPRFWQTFGYDPAAMPHKAETWQSIIHPDDLKVANENFQAHLADPALPYDQMVRYRHAVTGKWIWVRCWGIALRDDQGTPVRALGAHLDVTSLKETEGLLRGSVEDLISAREEAEQALKSKTVFLETMSHEIRTPMNGILGMSEALALQDLPPAAMTQVAVINRSASALLVLLNDVLDMARIEAGKISMEMDQLVPMTVIRDAAEVFAYMAQEKGLDLVCMGADALNAPIIASARSIRQVTNNLVGNAIKFSNSGDIEVRAYLRKSGVPERMDLVIKVIDRGPGVPDAKKDVIFDRFAQGEMTGLEKVQGTGLGLAIARQLCELHGGGLSVSDTPGGGATFEAQFQVRVVEAEAMPELHPEVKRLGHDPLRLLVVEDNEMNQMVLEALLSHMNADVTFAQNGLEGLKLAQTQVFDAGFIDIRMPVMSGTEFAQKWRAQEADENLAPLPLIACSANVLPHQVETYKEAGFDRHLPKPVTMAGLRSCINWIWSQRPAP